MKTFGLSVFFFVRNKNIWLGRIKKSEKGRMMYTAHNVGIPTTYYLDETDQLLT